MKSEKFCEDLDLDFFYFKIQLKILNVNFNTHFFYLKEMYSKRDTE